MNESSPWHLVVIDGRVFPLDVVVKATYWLSAHFDVDVRLGERQDQLIVGIKSRNGPLSEEAALAAESRFRRDLIDFRTRALIDEETRTLRDLLVAKAFDDDDSADYPPAR